MAVLALFSTPELIVACIAGITTLISGWFAFAIGKRQTSGQIEQSSAKEIWDQTLNLLQTYVGDNDRLRDEMAHVSARVRGIENETLECHKERVELERKVLALEGIIRLSDKPTPPDTTITTEVRHGGE